MDNPHTEIDEALLCSVLKSIPQKIVKKMLGGRQTIQLQRMADRWDFPIDGRYVDLFAVMARLWSFLNQYGEILGAVIDDSTEDGDDNSLTVRYLKAKIHKTEADAEAARLRVEEKSGSLCRREFVHDFLSRLANRVRMAGEQAQRNWGEDGFEIFHQIEKATREEIKKLQDDTMAASAELPEQEKPEPEPVGDPELPVKKKRRGRPRNS